MSLIVRNKTGGPVDINDLGIRIAASADRDILFKGIANVLDSVDLVTAITAGDVVILDPTDDVTELSLSESQDVIDTESVFNSGSSSDDLASVVVSNMSASALPLEFTNVLWDTTELENTSSIIEHNGINTERIDIKETGLYFIYFSASFDADPAEEQIDIRVLIDDVTVVPGSLRTASEDDEINDLSNSFTASLTAGTYLTLQARASGAGNTLHETSTFCVTRARGSSGAAGAQGPAGSGSTITVQEEGVNVANTPHTTLNFVGTPVTATDAGSGVTTITVSGGGGSSSVDRQIADASSTFVTTSQSLVDLTDMTLTTNDLGEAGTYVITFSCEYEHQTDNEICTFSLNIDSSEVASRRTVGYKKGEWGGFSMTHLATGVANGTVIKIQVSQADTDPDDDELTIENRQLVIDGVGDSNVV